MEESSVDSLPPAKKRLEETSHSADKPVSKKRKTNLSSPKTIIKQEQAPSEAQDPWKVDRHKVEPNTNPRSAVELECKSLFQSNGSENDVFDEEDEDTTQAESDGTHPGIDGRLTPLSNVKDMFKDITEKSLRPLPSKEDIGLRACANYLKQIPLRIGTICSGTESPILALSMIIQGRQLLAAIQNVDSPDLAMLDIDPKLEMNFEHLFSAEIVPWKQHYIETNFAPPILFSDITELTMKAEDGKVREATTAYGGKAIVPRDLDLLVAGFSCVDFSPLNTHKKTLEERGESGDTFFALREYAKEYRPKIIILENVCGAPWSNEFEQKKTNPRAGIDFLLGEVGYATEFVRADTKDFYLPQTRVRGYMICIDRSIYLSEKFDRDLHLPIWKEKPYPNDPKELLADLQDWRAIVEKSKRQASVPADLMLLRSDDPALEALNTQSNHLSIRKRQTTPWERCRIGYHNYRDDNFLGHRRELTDWVNGGSHVLEDFWKRQQKGLSERVLDTLDIAHLRNLVRGFDDRYYSRPLELSQNVYRVHDTTKPGIIGCLTPSGMPFLTSRGSRIIGLEALILQGLGLEELDLDMLTQGDLQDLAGNAMTSTVVGVMIAAALGVFHKKFLLDGRLPKEISSAIPPTLPGEEILQTKVAFSADYSNKFSLTKIMEEAKATRRLCTCEGRLHKKESGFQRCTICLHTTCKQCGIKPQHHYEDISYDELQKRKNPRSFETLIRSCIPAQINFSFNQDELEDFVHQVDKLESLRNIKGVSNTIIQTLNATLYLRTVRRDEFWEIIYDSAEANLVLTIAEDRVEWCLYAHDPNEGLGTERGKYFRRFPIARMRPTGEDINVGKWCLWLPDKREFNAKLHWHGKPEKTFAAQRGLIYHRGDFVYPKCQLSISGFDNDYFERDIQGQYNLSQVCAQPQNTLHALSCISSEKPLFFYLEQHLRTGESGYTKGDHYFVFTEDQHRLEKLDERRTFARFSKSWRPPLIKLWDAELHTGLLNVDELKGEVLDATKLKDLNQNPRDVQFIKRLEAVQVTYDQIGTKIVAEGRWVPIQLTVNAKPSTKLWFNILPFGLRTFEHHNACNGLGFGVFSFKADLERKIARPWKKDVWNFITKANEARFMREFGWAILKGSVMPGHSQKDLQWHSANAEGQHCFTCSPEPPRLLWSRNAEGKAVPCEEPVDATSYEKRLKTRPTALLAQFLFTKEDTLHLKVGANPQTLIHRATALLNSFAFASSINATVKASWRLVTDDQTNPDVLHPKLTLIENKHYPGNVKIPGLKPGIILREEQMRALLWALSRDRGEVAFTEEEVVEERLNQLGYLLEGKATREVNPKGGLMFFDVGFGKTLITLALISCCLEKDSKSTEDLMQNNLPSTAGKIPLKATLIFVPAHLTKQWEAEADKFLKDKKGSKVLVINNIASLKGKTIRDFKAADIIVFNWKSLSGEAYQKALAQFAGMVERDETSHRTKSLWYKKASSKIAEVVQSMHAENMTPEATWTKICADYAIEQVACDQVDVYIPTKRTKGKAYTSVADRITSTGVQENIEGSEGKTAQRNKVNHRKEETPRTRKPFMFTGTVDDLKSPLLEIFSFPRLVIDEFTYLLDDPIALLMANSLSVTSRFALSGTPNLANFANVNQLASLLNIHLGVKDYSSMKPEEFAQATKDMSRSETFLAYKSNPSTGWHSRRHDSAQNFLNVFARNDKPNLENIVCIEYIRLVDLHPAQKAIYFELQQRVASSTSDNLRSKNIDSDVERQIQAVICGGDDPRRALLLRASHVKLDDEDTDLNKKMKTKTKKKTPASSVVRILEDQEISDNGKSHGNVSTVDDDDGAVDDENLDLMEISIDEKAPHEEKASVTQDYSVSLQAVIDKRNAQYETMKGELAKYLKKALWLETDLIITHERSCPNLRDWVKRVKDGGFHDQECQRDLLDLIKQADLTYHVDDWKLYYIKPDETMERKRLAEKSTLQPFPTGKNTNTNTGHLLKIEAHLRTATMQISKLTEVMVNHIRSMRFMDAINKVQKGFSYCSACDLLIPNPRDVTILGNCGHTICSSCLVEDSDECCAPFCDAEVKKHQKVTGHQLFDHIQDVDSSNSRKVDSIIALILEAKEAGDKVLLFVQFPKLVKMLSATMKENNIEYADMTVLGNQATTLSKFQEDSNSAHVLIMDPAGESAAGANLTMANRVIFASPLYTSGPNAQYRYESTMTQAIGRARRYGQTKPVKVYHFLSVNTIDVDLFEHRKGQAVKRSDTNYSHGELFDGIIAEADTLRSAIAHINYSGSPMTD